MSLNTQFRNATGSIITIQQKNSLEDYYELKFIDNTLKMEFLYYNNEIVNGTYFMSPGENINNVIGSLDLSHKWSIMSDKEIINGYSVWKKNYMYKGTLSVVYSKTVFNSNNQEVAQIGYDSSGMPTRGGYKILNIANKNIIFDVDDIDGFFDNDAEVIFYFDENGEISSIDTNTKVFSEPYTILPKFLREQKDGPILNLMTPAMLSYFTNFLPLVPNF
ncbi:hypothetical protein [Flavobacterium piscisymbiosum]|uniref:YD repeat-containing protein n=1 Tax=Flavobacterium piscisymbiosum TaxID=2893753 RepID=A0ABS8MLL3_9FLAO|nr:hypothetical protein [Flavobacterium sp. F-30]MCC9066385.1 hypothetical protein [Flavobacterium sp. F-30]